MVDVRGLDARFLVPLKDLCWSHGRIAIGQSKKKNNEGANAFVNELIVDRPPPLFTCCPCGRDPSRPEVVQAVTPRVTHRHAQTHTQSQARKAALRSWLGQVSGRSTFFTHTHTCSRTTHTYSWETQHVSLPTPSFPPARRCRRTYRATKCTLSFLRRRYGLGQLDTGCGSRGTAME